MNFGLSFTNPWALLLWPPLAIYFVWLARRSLADLSRARRNLAVALRLIVSSLVVLAIAGAQLVRFNRDMAVMFVVDFSDSVGPTARTAAEKYVREAVNARKEGDWRGIVVFGREAFVDLAAGPGKVPSKILTLPPSEFTDLSAAIRLGIASLPEGFQKRVVVLSDGNENLGDALSEAQVASNNEVKIDVVPLTAPPRNEVLLEKMTLPNETKIGEPIEVKILARASEDTSATIKLFRNGKYLGDKAVSLSRGRNALVFPQTVTDSGASNFEALLETPRGTDTRSENNRALGLVNVQGKPKVLLIDNDPTQARFLVSALKREKLNVEVRGAGGLPTQLRDMQPYDAIILGNVPAWDLSATQMLSLQSYVRDLGCGLVMVGGENSFGPGGYRSTPVEEALPVTMDIKNMQYIPGGAVAIIMHSLEFQNGNDWAKSICSQVTRQLGDNDYAGLCIFGMDPTWVYPMLKVGPNRNKMLALTRGINPGDMPDFDSALELCYDGLIKTNAYLKHVVILSDGDPSPPRPALVKKFNDARITVSTVAIQPHDNSGFTSMYNIAKQHGGKFYRVTNPKTLPNIFLKEAATISRSAIIEETFTPRFQNESAILKGIAKLPPLLGYVGTSPKATSRVVLSSHQDDPVLATWQYGLGRSVAFTSDARQRWGAGWLGWSGFSKFWAQSVRWSMRQSTSGDLNTLVDIDKGRGKVSIEAVDEKGNFLNFLNPKARLVTPDLKGRELTLDQTGPGRYEATFDARQLGTYLVNIRTRRGDKNTSQISGGVLPYSPEYNAIGTNDYLLTRLSETANGERLSLENPRAVYSRPRVDSRAPRDIFLPLLMLAACLFPLDVAARRLMWGETELQKLQERLRRRRGAKVQTPKPREGGMDRLLKTKTQAGKSTSSVAPTSDSPPPSATTTPSTRVDLPTASGTAIPVSRPVEAPQSTAGVPETPSSASQSTADAPQSTAEPEVEELDSMERLRRAKRRARGEE